MALNQQTIIHFTEKKELFVTWGRAFSYKIEIYGEHFYFVDRFYGSALHGDRGRRSLHTNFADESECLTADSVRNEVVTLQRSQVLKTLSLYT
jgi:hypothetical protein